MGTAILQMKDITIFKSSKVVTVVYEWQNPKNLSKRNFFLNEPQYTLQFYSLVKGTRIEGRDDTSLFRTITVLK